MTTLLADHNVEGHAHLLLGAIQASGWAELLDVRVATLVEIGLTARSPDRLVWRRAQELGMLLLTDNRNNSGLDTLEQTLIEEHTLASLPVLTIGRAKRVRDDRAYREACAERIIEILVDLEAYRGVTRLFIP